MINVNWTRLHNGYVFIQESQTRIGPSRPRCQLNVVNVVASKIQTRFAGFFKQPAKCTTQGLISNQKRAFLYFVKLHLALLNLSSLDELKRKRMAGPTRVCTVDKTFWPFVGISLLFAFGLAGTVLLVAPITPFDYGLPLSAIRNTAALICA